MKLTKELAEILGMFAADGCLQKDYICMWGNIYEDKDYYDNIVCPLYSRVLNKKIVAHEKKSNSVYGFYVCSKDIVEMFRGFGFTNNKTYSVEIPQMIKDSDSKEILAAFVRGYADCDGCFSLMKRKGKYSQFKLKFNTYPRIEISSVSEKVISQIGCVLNRLGIDYRINIGKSKIVREVLRYKIMIRGPERIEKFMQIVGFNNPAQHTRYLVWKKFGFCPPKIGVVQRKLILKGELNPADFYKN